MSYTILIDSREQQPWHYDGRTRGCDGTEVTCLKTGDYTVKGLEDLLVVERKKSVSELAGNLFEDRFRRELDRMKGVPFAYVVLDFPLDHVLDYPRVPTVPHVARKKIKISGSFLFRTFLEFERDFPWVRFHFAGGRGSHFAAGLFKRAVDYAAQMDRTPASPAASGGGK